MATQKRLQTTEAAWVRWVLVGTALAFMLLFLVLPLIVIGVVLERFIIKGMAAGAVK